MSNYIVKYCTKHHYDHTFVGSCPSCAEEQVTISNMVAIPSSVSGIKHDQDKPDLSLISKDLMVELAKVRMFGAKKYDRWNWTKGFKFSRSIAASLRHIMAFNSGEDLDPESGLPHMVHAIACLEHLLNDYLHNPSNDDRNKPNEKN